MKTSEVLDRAADLIQERGWAQADGWMVERLPTPVPVCAQGALRVACLEATGRLDPDPEWRRLYFDVTKPLMQRHVGESILFAWNDSPGRTAEDVIAAFRAAAVIEAAREEQDAAWQTYAELVSA